MLGAGCEVVFGARTGIYSIPPVTRYSGPFWGYHFLHKNTGRARNTPIILNTRPPMVPMARENQKISLWPSITKGISPKQVERTVSRIGTAFPATDLMTFRL